MKQQTKDALRTDLINVTAQTISERGLTALSLRDITAAVGKSTTVVFTLFGDKAGLLARVAEAAMAQDVIFHETFNAQIEELPLDGDIAADIILRYISMRTHSQARFARIWQEFLLYREHNPQVTSILRDWAQMRRTFWRNIMGRHWQLNGLCEVMFDYLLMEEFYACALWGRPEYDLLLAQNIRSMTARTGDRISGGDMALTHWVGQRYPPAHPPTQPIKPASLKMRLLEAAADEILENGISSLTNRSVAARAKSSTSTVLYHFATMRDLTLDAVYHAFFRELPDYLNYRRSSEVLRPADLEGWAQILGKTVSPAEENGKAGYYIAYGRLLAEICLNARKDKTLKSLAMALRGAEGSGTYHGRDTVWPPQFAMTRLSATHFAIWIKGYALTHATLSIEADLQPSHVRLMAAARALVPEDQN